MKPEKDWVREGTEAVPTRASASICMSLYSMVMLGSVPPALHIASQPNNQEASINLLDILQQRC